MAGCETNQVQFSALFDHIALLSAPAEVRLAPIDADQQPLRQAPGERDAVIDYLNTVEPLLRATATVEIDATAPIQHVVRQIETLRGRWPADDAAPP